MGGDSLPRGPQEHHPRSSMLLMLMTIPPLLSQKSFPSEGKSEIQLLQLMRAGFYFLSTSTRSLRPASKMAFSAQGQLQSPCESRGALAPGNGQGGCTPSSCHSAQHQQLWRGGSHVPTSCALCVWGNKLQRCPEACSGTEEKTGREAKGEAWETHGFRSISQACDWQRYHTGALALRLLPLLGVISHWGLSALFLCPPSSLTQVLC